MLLVVSCIMGFFLILLGIISLFSLNNKKFLKALWMKYLAWFIIIPPILIPLIFSRILFLAVIYLLSIFCFREYARMTGLWSDRRFMFSAYAAISLIYFPVFLGKTAYGSFQAFPIYAIIAVLLVPVFYDEYSQMIQKASLGMLGVAYFGWFFSHLAFLRNCNNGIELITFLLLLTEMNDASAYLGGNLFGKHKLVPRLSPNKTVEGVFVSIAFTTGMAFLLHFLVPFISNLHILLTALLISVGGTTGDLVISFIKRDLGVKDTGRIIPMHGGLLDRFDSLVFTVPLYFHFINCFYGIIK